MPSADSFHDLVSGRRRGPLAALARAGLWWARLPYAVGVGVRNWRYDGGRRSARVPVPVVCVGNLTLGGTGKTPMVEYVARFYRELDKAVAILSRGYGTTGGANDEALVLEENLPDVPHLQGADRVALANTAVEELESEILVLDDGYQHRKLYRDLDIVLLDATRPIRKEYLFPRGLLRESVNGLKRAGFAVFTRCDQVPAESLAEQRAWLTKRLPTLPQATCVHRPVELIRAGSVSDGHSATLSEAVDLLNGKPVAGFCGVGNPESFRRTLTDLGATVVDFRAFADHHPYTRAYVDALRAWAAKLPADATLATTQKDWVKLRVGELGGRPLRAVRVGVRFTSGEVELRTMLREVLPDLGDD